MLACCHVVKSATMLSGISCLMCNWAVHSMLLPQLIHVNALTPDWLGLKQHSGRRTRN